MVVLSVEILEKFDIINSYKGGEYMSHNQFIEKYNHISEEFILGGGVYRHRIITSDTYLSI